MQLTNQGVRTLAALLALPLASVAAEGTLAAQERAGQSHPIPRGVR